MATHNTPQTPHPHPLTEGPSEVELGSGCLDRNEGIGQSCDERGLADELWVHIVCYGECFFDYEEPDQTASTHKKLINHSPLYKNSRNSSQWTKLILDNFLGNVQDN